MNTLLTVLLIVVVAILVIDWLNKFRLTKAVFNRLRKTGLDAAQAARNPVADATVALSDLKNRRNERNGTYAKIITEIAKLKSRKARAQENITKWENIARSAGSKGNADDVRTALNNKVTSEKEMAQIDAQMATLEKQSASMKDAIDTLDRQLATAETNLKSLSSAIDIAQFKEEIAKTLGSDGEVNSVMQQLEDDVVEANARAEAAGVINESTQSLADKYSTPSVTDEDIAKYLKP